jgi:hypothetical protein
MKSSRTRIYFSCRKTTIGRSSDENFPDVPSVRVLRTRVIVLEMEEKKRKK